MEVLRETGPGNYESVLTRLEPIAAHVGDYENTRIRYVQFIERTTERWYAAAIPLPQ